MKIRTCQNNYLKTSLDAAERQHAGTAEKSEIGQGRAEKRAQQRRAQKGIIAGFQAFLGFGFKQSGSRKLPVEAVKKVQIEWLSL